MRYSTLIFDGSIAVGIQRNSTTKALAVTLGRLPVKHKPGESLSWDDPTEPIMAMEFKTDKSIDVIIKALNKLKECRYPNFESLVEYNGNWVEV